MLQWDLFISHASEDKKSFVDPLAHRLQELAVRVWYDKFTLIPGDRLSEKIAEGLAQSRCGLLILSNSFINKPWPSYELSGLVNRFIEEKLRLIPVWLGVSRNEISSLNPALADLFAIIGNPSDIDSCAMEILKVVRPQLHENIMMLKQLDLDNIRFESVNFADLNPGPIRHQDLPASLLIRIQNIHYVFRKLLTHSLEESILDFHRDLEPEREVIAWEYIVSAFNLAIDTLKLKDIKTKKQVLNTLIHFSLGNQEKIAKNNKPSGIDDKVYKAATDAWKNVVPSVTIQLVS